MRRQIFLAAAAAVVLFMGVNASARDGQRIIPLDSLFLMCNSSDQSEPTVMVNIFDEQAVVRAMVVGPGDDRKGISASNDQVRTLSSQVGDSNIFVSFVEVAPNQPWDLALELVAKGTWGGTMSTMTAQGAKDLKVTCQILPPFLDL